MAIILKANRVNLFVCSVLFVFWYHSPIFSDTPCICPASSVCSEAVCLHTSPVLYFGQRLTCNCAHLASCGTRGTSSGKLWESVACQCRTFSLDAAMASSVRCMARKGKKLRAVSSIRPLWRKTGASLSRTLLAMTRTCWRGALRPLPAAPSVAGTRATS
jgi:hypothetical protein